MKHGKHVKVVGKGAASMLASPYVVEEFLLTLVNDLGMRALSYPHVHDVKLDLSKMNKEPFEDEGGVTGVVILSTSHCAIHTWPARSFLIADIFSCRDFDITKVEDCLRTHFGAFRCKVHDLSASLDYNEFAE